MSDFTNSYTRYFNVKHDRVGPLFQGKFKSVFIETEEQLIHLSRYLHLNPYTSGLVKEENGLINYEFSSLSDYVDGSKHGFIDTSLVLSHFERTSDYWKFVLSQRDYQRKLGIIKKLAIEKVS